MRKNQEPTRDIFNNVGTETKYVQIHVTEYRELLMIKGKYEELKEVFNNIQKEKLSKPSQQPLLREINIDTKLDPNEYSISMDLGNGESVSIPNKQPRSLNDDEIIYSNGGQSRFEKNHGVGCDKYKVSVDPNSLRAKSGGFISSGSQG